jgi:hypothetical protein
MRKKMLKITPLQILTIITQEDEIGLIVFSTAYPRTSREDIQRVVSCLCTISTKNVRNQFTWVVLVNCLQAQAECLV